MKILRVYLDRKYLVGFRIIMLLVACFFLVEAYEIYSSGEAISRRNVATLGVSESEDFAYYSALGKKLAFGLFFTWLGTFGSTDTN